MAYSITTLVILQIILFGSYFTNKCFSQENTIHPNTRSQQEKYPDSDAVFLLDEGKIELKESGKAVGKFHVKLRILNERGLHHKELQLLGGKSTRVANFSGTVIKPDGEKRKVKDKEILDTSYLSKNRVYQDIQVKSILFHEVSVGCILDYEKEIHYDSFIDLPSWEFDGSYPVERSFFSIQFPAKVKLLHSNLDSIPSIKFTKTLVNGDSLFTWTADSLPAIPIEPNMPTLQSLRKRILFWTPDIRFQGKTISLASWQDVVNWYLDRLEGKLNFDNSIFAKIPAYSLAKNAIEKAKVIYQFVQDGFRYIDVDFGDGRYEPNDAQTIMRRRYGDVKDFVIVVTALLRAAKIEAYPVLLKTRDFGPIVKKIVTLHQFDYMIVASIIDGDTLYMDPTYIVCPYKLLPSYAQASSALILKRDHEVWKTTPVFAANFSDFRNFYGIRFDPSGAIEVTGTLYANGLVGDAFKTLVKVGTKKEMRKLIENYFNSWIPGIKLIEQDFTSTFSQTNKQDTSQAHFQGHFKFKCDNYYSAGDSLIFFKSNLLNKTQVPAFAIHPYDERFHPVVFDNKFTEFDSVEVLIPEGYELFFVPEDVEINKEFASYENSYKTLPSSIIHKIHFELKTVKIDTTAYNEMREFYIAIAQTDQEGIIFKKR